MKRFHKQPAISVTALIFAFLLLCNMHSARSAGLEYVSSIVLNHFYDVCADEKYAYCTTSYGLAILKIYDPKYMNLTASIYLKDSVYQLQNSGDYVYIANGDAGLKIIDVTRRYQPKVVGTCSTPGKVRAVCVKDSLVYLGQDNSGIQIINVADPENPYIAGSYDSPNSSFFAHNMVLKDSLIYAATESDCIEIINVKNPTAPAYIGNFCGATKPMSLAIAGDTMFVGDDSGDCLKIFDISNPVNPAFISSASSDYSEPYDIAYYDEGYVFISDFRGISAFNIRNIDNPFRAGSYNSASGPSYLCIVNDFICYTTKTYGFFTVSMKPFLTTIGNYVTPYIINSVEVSDTLAYLNIIYYGPVIANISDPANPFWVDDMPIHCGRSSSSLTYFDGYLYHTCQELYIFDMNDPINPLPVKMIKEFPGPNEYFAPIFEDVIVDDNRAYVREDHICIYEISDPPNAFKIGEIYYGNNLCRDFFIDSSTDRLYACYTYGDDIRIYDLSNPPQFWLLGFYEHTYNTGLWPNRVNHICAHGDFAYFAYSDTIHVLDVSDPANPDSLAYYHLPWGTGTIHYLDVINDLVIVGRSNKIYILDVSDPSNPTQLIYHDLPFGVSAQDIWIAGNYLYVAAYDSFMILRLNLEAGSSAPICGDTNHDGIINLTDLTMLINFLYSEEVSPINPEAADFDNSGTINLLDITYLIRYLFTEGPEPECNL